MPSLLVRPSEPDANGCVTHIDPENAGWDHVGFDMYKLTAGATLALETGDREHCLVVVSGTIDATVDGTDYLGLGGRASPFKNQAPGTLYIPAGKTYAVTAKDDVELAVCSAKGGGDHAVGQIPDENMVRFSRGEGANTRHVRNILGDSDDLAHSLFVIEVITPSGNWSSYPPHKHDTDALPDESCLEETYYHRLDPSQGFAFQRVYTDDRSLDETMTVQDGDVVKVPRGYHPAGAPFAYDLYYLNVMAGPTRRWVFRNDPAHEWMLES